MDMMDCRLGKMCGDLANQTVLWRILRSKTLGGGCQANNIKDHQRLITWEVAWTKQFQSWGNDMKWQPMRVTFCLDFVQSLARASKQDMKEIDRLPGTLQTSFLYNHTIRLLFQNSQGCSLGTSKHYCAACWAAPHCRWCWVQPQ